MAVVSYPSVTPSTETRIAPRQSIEYDVMADGSTRGRVVHAKTTYDATIEHPWVSESDLTTLLQHYADHKTDTVQFAYGGRVFDLYYLGEPEVVVIGGGGYSVTTKMIGNLYE